MLPKIRSLAFLTELQYQCRQQRVCYDEEPTAHISHIISHVQQRRAAAPSPSLRAVSRWTAERPVVAVWSPSYGQLSIAQKTTFEIVGGCKEKQRYVIAAPN